MANFNIASHDFQETELREKMKTFDTSIQAIYGFGIPGDFIEFGTFAGITARMIAASMNYCENAFGYADTMHSIQPRALFLCDSFDGLPEIQSIVDLESPHVQAKVWRPGLLKGLSPTELREACAKYVPTERIVTVVGWFSDTLPLIQNDRRFALVHIDCDLYLPTSEILDWLFLDARVSDGGIILFDDWNCNRASQKYGQRKAWSEAIKKYKFNFEDCGDYALAGHKFRVWST